MPCHHKKVIQRVTSTKMYCQLA